MLQPTLVYSLTAVLLVWLLLHYGRGGSVEVEVTEKELRAKAHLPPPPKPQPKAKRRPRKPRRTEPDVA